DPGCGRQAYRSLRRRPRCRHPRPPAGERRCRRPVEGGLRHPRGADAGPADLRDRLPHRAVAPVQAEARRPAPRGPLRALHLPARAGQCLLGAERPAGPAAALRGTGRSPRARRRGGALDGRGLPARARVRHAAGGGRGDRHRPPRHAVHGLALDPGRHPLPSLETRARPRRRDRARGDGALSVYQLRGRGLPFELFLGLRYLRARGHRANLSLFVWIGVGGAFLGVSALIVVLAVMTGFQDGIREKIIAANPHILIIETGGRGVADAGALARRVEPTPGVTSATPFVLQQALFTARGGGATGGLLRGVDLNSPAVRALLAAQVKLGRLEPLLRTEGEPAILLGRELARSLGAVPGDHVTVISPQGAMTAVGLVPKMRRFEVAGFVEVGMYEYDSSLAYTGLAAAQEFAGLGDREEIGRAHV